MQAKCSLCVEDEEDQDARGSVCSVLFFCHLRPSDIWIWKLQLLAQKQVKEEAGEGR